MEQVSLFLRKVLERPTSHKVAFWVASLGFFCFIFYQYVYAGVVKQHAEAKTAIENLLTEKINEQRLIKNFSKVKKAVEELDKSLNQALLELPDKSEIPDLLTSISNLAKESGLEVQSFRPKPESIEEFYAEIPVSLQVRGSFHQLGSFFDEVSHLDRVVNINNIVLKKPDIVQGETRADVSAECLATTYRYLDEKERKVENADAPPPAS